MEEGTKRLGIGGSEKPNRRIPINASSGPFLFRFGVSVVDGSALKGLTPAIGASPNFVLPQKVLSDSNTFLWCSLSRTRVYLIFIGATVVWFISLEIPMRWQNRNTDTLIFLFAVFTYSHHKRVRAVFESFRLVAYHINCFAHVGFRFNSRFNSVSAITAM